MKKELVGLLILSLTIFLSSGIFAIGEDCFITDRNSCESNGHVIMGISSTSNAHAELANQNNYDDVLCCNFAGSSTCDTQNKIIGLSSSTNAHGEIPTQGSSKTHIVEVNMDEFGSGYGSDDITINVGDTVRWVQTDMMAHTVTSDDNSDGMMDMGDGELFSSGNMDTGDVYEFTFNEVGEFQYYCDYHLMPMPGMMPMKGKVTVVDASFTELCYSDLECISTSFNCESITEKNYISLFSLSNFTNAHIGEIDDYDIKICCTSESFGASSLNIYWSDDGVNKISNLDVITGTTSVKMVLKNSGLTQGTIVSFNIYEDDMFLDDYIKTITAVIGIDGEATAEWTITLEDLEKTLNDYDELFFEANNEVSDYLTLNLLEISECQNIILCSDYENENLCINNNCQIAETGAPSDVDCNDPTISCYCSWNTQCDFEFELEEGNVTIGTCTFVESTNDDCSDGFLSYSWIATWNDVLETQPAECSDGSRVIECPAQIQLPFFGVYNLIAAILLIIIIYLIIILRKNKMLKLKKFLKKFY